MLLPIHIAAGGLVLALGAVALLVKKGGPTHRRSGLLFVYAMVVMATTAAILGNAVGGLMTIYFVGTALTTVRPASPLARSELAHSERRPGAEKTAFPPLPLSRQPALDRDGGRHTDQRERIADPVAHLR